MRPPEHPPGYKEGYYSKEYKCINCDCHMTIQIPKGKIAPKRSEQPCRNCGCKTLYKK